MYIQQMYLNRIKFRISCWVTGFLNKILFHLGILAFLVIMQRLFKLILSCKMTELKFRLAIEVVAPNFYNLFSVSSLHQLIRLTVTVS